MTIERTTQKIDERNVNANTVERLLWCIRVFHLTMKEERQIASIDKLTSGNQFAEYQKHISSVLFVASIVIKKKTTTQNDENKLWQYI